MQFLSTPYCLKSFSLQDTTATEEGGIDDQGKIGGFSSKNKLKLKTCDLSTTDETFKNPVE